MYFLNGLIRFKILMRKLLFNYSYLVRRKFLGFICRILFCKYLNFLNFFLDLGNDKLIYFLKKS